MVGFISFVARSVSGLDSSAVEKNPPDVNVMSHTAEDMSRTMTANDAEGVSSAACLGHVVCLATCARVWISSQLLKTKPIVVSVYAMVCCGPYRFVFACIRMLGEGGDAAMLPSANSSVSRLCPTRWYPTVSDGLTK